MLIATSSMHAEAQRLAHGPNIQLDEAGPPGLEVIPDSTDLVIITRRAGVAARLAHDHLIAAHGWELGLELPHGHEAEGVSFHLTVPVDSLGVDDPDLQARLEGRLRALEVLPDAFSTTSVEERGRIREAMRAENQLNALTHPLVEVRLVSAKRDPEDLDFPYALAVELAAGGGKAVAEMRGRVVETEGRVQVEAFGPMHFTQLGIEPYSAYWGLVRNQDRFYLYLSLRAFRVP